MAVERVVKRHGRLWNEWSVKRMNVKIIIISEAISGILPIVPLFDSVDLCFTWLPLSSPWSLPQTRQHALDLCFTWLSLPHVRLLTFIDQTTRLKSATRSSFSHLQLYFGTRIKFMESANDLTARLYNDSAKWSDIIIKYGEHQIHAHKAILVQQSRYFLTAFTTLLPVCGLHPQMTVTHLTWFARFPQAQSSI